MNKKYKQILYVNLIVFMLLVPCTIQAQQKKLWKEKQAYNWCFGFKGGINFESGTPTTFSSQFESTEGGVSISNANGELMFYGGNNKIWDRNHTIMLNGDGLVGLGLNQTQSGVIVPKPGNPDIYYVFGLSDRYYNDIGPSYSIVDMTLNDGYGAVTDKNIMLGNTASSEKITAVFHANGKDVWVITHLFQSNSFEAYLVTENGVTTTPVVSQVGVTYDSQWDAWAYAAGQLKASPDGKRLAAAIIGAFQEDYRGAEVFDFNNETGEISNPFFLESSVNPGMMYGLEFSPNSQYLYVAELALIFIIPLEGKLQQYDLNAGDVTAVKNSKTTIMDLMGTSYCMASLQLAPNGKIYISNGFWGEEVHVVNYPNNKGLAAGAQSAAISTGFGSGLVLPGFIQNYFESGIESEGNCPNQDVTFTTVRIPGITSISWDFGDPASGAANISNQPVHAFSGPGTYTVTATITSNGAIQTATTEVVIIEGPKAVAPAAELLVKCADENGTAVFDLSAFNATILAGQDTDIFSLAYYATEADRLADNPIADLSNFTTAGQTIYAVVTNSETGCRTILPLVLVVNPLPVVAVPAPIEQCGDLAGNSVFNLKNQDVVILNGQNAADFTIAYYTDEALANVIGQPESFTSGGQTIYAEVTNTVTGCSSSVAFNVVVIEVDLIGAELIVEGCSPFNLTTVLPQIPTGVTVNFYLSEQDALNETNAIADTENYMPAAGIDKIYVIATSAEGCQSVNELQLKYLGCVIPRGISPNGDGLNDTFDLSAFDVKTLKIFNRYGKEVYTKDNYTNQFFGQGTHGHDLPTGTYYYMIQLGSGEQKTGWVYLNLEEK